MILHGVIYDNYDKIIISTNQTDVLSFAYWGMRYEQSI